ncbi:MAG: hypothetical protein WD016_12415 [Balneolaceae bacterium]
MKFISLRLSAFGSFIFLCTLLGPLDISAQTVNTHISTDSVFVGDVFHYSLVLQLDEEYNRLIFPDTTAFPSSLELLRQQQFKLSQFSDSLAYRLQFFGSEDIRISSMPVVLISGQDSTTIYTDPVVIYFKSMVDEGDSSIRPLKPIFGFPRAWWPWIIAALLIAAFLIWWFKFREEPEKKTTKPLPQIKPFYNPLKELENTLVSIKKNSKVTTTKDFKTYYSEISDAIRKYYEDLYKIPALESTSRELLRYLDAYGADQEMLDYTRKVLMSADLVKFAKYTPTLDDAQNTYEVALNFLERAKQADSTRISHLRSQYEAQFARPETNKTGA